MARDLHALVHDELGHERCAAAGGDLGGVVIQDLGLRFDGLRRAPVPLQHGPAAAARRVRARRASRRDPARDAHGGRLLPAPGTRRRRAGRRARHARSAGAATSRSSTARRFWATPGAFDARRRRLHDRAVRRRRAAARRASASTRRALRDAAGSSEPPRLFETNPVPTLVLYGPDDHVIPRDFPERCEVAFTELRRPVRRAAGRATSSSGSAPTSLNQSSDLLLRATCRA